MTRAVHHDIIVAKARNMNLVLLAFGGENDTGIPEEGDEWFEYGNTDGYFPTLYDSSLYFLCLEKHKEMCLYWLDGGALQWRDETTEWTDKSDYKDDAI